MLETSWLDELCVPHCNISPLSSSSRSHTTASSGSSAPPPPYDTIRSNDSCAISGASSRSNFIIKDKKLETAIKSCYIEASRLQLGELLKEGNFGAVYRGRLNNHGRQNNVAVKTLKTIGDGAAFEEFMREGVLMKGKFEKLIDPHFIDVF